MSSSQNFNRKTSKKRNGKTNEDTAKKSTSSFTLKLIILIFIIAAVPFVLFNPDISLGPLDFLRKEIFSSEIVLKGEKVSPDGFVKAIKSEDLKLVKLYIKSGLDINALDSEGISPLCYAVSLGNVEIVNAMLKEDVNLLIKNLSDGYTPAFCAVRSDNEEVLDSLAAKGIDFNIRNENANGMAPLHYAAMLGKNTSVSYLIKSGANVNLHDVDGKTPLYYAVQQDNIIILHILLNGGADVGLKDDDGVSPLDIAIQAGNSQYINLLQNYVVNK